MIEKEKQMFYEFTNNIAPKKEGDFTANITTEPDGVIQYDYIPKIESDLPSKDQLFFCGKPKPVSASISAQCPISHLLSRNDSPPQE